MYYRKINDARPVKTIYLLRHAKARPAEDGIRDFDRTLTPQGRAAAAKIGEYMKRGGYLPGQVFCSASVRTRETTEEVLAAFGKAPAPECAQKLYLASAGELLYWIHQADERATSVLFVGHNPGIQQCALQLAGAGPQEMLQDLILSLPTGSLVILRSAAAHWRDVAPGECELMEFVQPKRFG